MDGVSLASVERGSLLGTASREEGDVAQGLEASGWLAFGGEHENMKCAKGSVSKVWWQENADTLPSHLLGFVVAFCRNIVLCLWLF